MADELLLLTSGEPDNLLLTSGDDLLLASSTAAGSGTANAECATFTFAAQAATVSSSSNVSAECATFTFAAQNATVFTDEAGIANAECAEFTFQALSPNYTAQAECAEFTFAAQGPLVVTRNGNHRNHVWQVRVEQNGALLGTIASAVPGRYTFRSGFEFGEFEFTCSVHDPDLIAFLPYGDDMVAHEIALYEDGVLRWKGRPSPWDARLKDQTVTIRCRTFEHDFDRRFFGWAERLNILENGSFEFFDLGTSQPPTSWTEVGVNATRTDAIAEGTYAVQLTASDTTSYLMQQEASAFDIEYYPGLTVVATAWGKITSGTVADGDVLAELVAAGSPGTFTEQFVADEAIVSGVMFRMAIPLFVSAGQDWTGELRLYGIDGTIVWDDAEIVFGDSTTVFQNGGAGEDLARLVENVTEYAQTGDGWSNLFIDHDCPDTGTNVLRGFEHEHHEWIASAYRTLIDEYGVDIWVGLDRVLHLRNKRGNRRPELAVTIDADDSTTLNVLADHSVSGDPGQASNVAIVTGESHLFAADEAGAKDTSKHGGLTLAKWERAPVSFQPLDLSHRADEIVAKEGTAPALPDLLILMDDDHGHPTQIVEVGDVIPVTISYGWIQIDADYRVTMVDTDPRTRVQRVTVDAADSGLYLDSDKCASFRVTAYDATVTTS